MNWPLITHLGDAALVLPLLAVAMAGLALQGKPQRRAAFQWAAIVVTSLLLVAASKIAFYGWGTGIRRWNLTCFSGHTVSAWLAWPVLLMLMAPAQMRALRIVLPAAGMVIALLVGWSRVPLSAHPISEVVAGTVLGACTGGLSIRVLWRQAFDVRARVLIGMVLLTLAIVSQTDLDRPHTERWFQAIAATLSGAESTHDRANWRAQ